MSNKPRDDLHYFKWEVTDLKAIQQLIEAGVITLAHVGELFLAVMSYVDKVEVDVSPEVKVLFATYKVRVDNKREARVKAGESRVEPGRLGGQAKAANAKKQAAAAAFKPPLRKQFQEAVKHFVDNDEIEPTDNYAVDVFYDSLKEAGWTIGGEPIQRRSDWESAILAKFYNPSNPHPSQQYYRIFKRIFSEFQGLRDADGRSQADDAASEFFDTFDESSKNWEVEGETFPQSEWQAALALFMKQYTENIPP